MYLIDACAVNRKLYLEQKSPNRLPASDCYGCCVARGWVYGAMEVDNSASDENIGSVSIKF